MARRTRAAMSLTMDTKKFSAAAKRYAKESGRTHHDTARILMLALLKSVILRTPVRFGRARGGWGAGLEGLGLRPGSVSGGGPEYHLGLAVSSYREQSSPGRIRLTVENGVEYIEALEYGHSKQAPFGMLRISMMELEARLSGGKLPKAILRQYQRVWDAVSKGKRTALTAGAFRAFAELGGSIG